MDVHTIAAWTPAGDLGIHDLLAIHHGRVAAVRPVDEERVGDGPYYTVGIFGDAASFRKTTVQKHNPLQRRPISRCSRSSRR